MRRLVTPSVGVGNLDLEALTLAVADGYTERGTEAWGDGSIFLDFAPLAGAPRPTNALSLFLFSFRFLLEAFPLQFV